jgi:thermostable 8-oxoguanine DNA glycosylase
MVKVGGRSCVERSAFLRNVDVDDFLCLDVEDRTEIERVGVLKIINAGSVVHQSLLKSGSISVALIVTFETISTIFVNNR